MNRGSRVSGRIVLRDALWFVGFMSLYAIWVTHLAGWAAETPVEPEGEDSVAASVEPESEETDPLPRH